MSIQFTSRDQYAGGGLSLRYGLRPDAYRQQKAAADDLVSGLGAYLNDPGALGYTDQESGKKADGIVLKSKLDNGQEVYERAPADTILKKMVFFFQRLFGVAPKGHYGKPDLKSVDLQGI